MTHIAPELLRRAFSESIAAEVAQFDRVEPRFLQRPTVHLRALDPQATLVAGMRGAGKSFWWHALQDPALRALALPTSANRSTASAGFGEGDAADRPGQDVMEQLFAQGYPPKLIWKAVVLRHALAAAAFRGLTERPWTRRGDAGYEVPDELRQNETYLTSSASVLVCGAKGALPRRR